MTTSPGVVPAPRGEHFHLIILDPTLTHALVRTKGPLWLLPSVLIGADEPDVQTPLAFVDRHLASLGIAARPIHDALLTERPALPDALGDSWQHYALFEACPGAIRGAHLRWVHVDTLLDGSRALNARHLPALRRALARLGPALGPDGQERLARIARIERLERLARLEWQERLEPADASDPDASRRDTSGRASSSRDPIVDHRRPEANRVDRIGDAPRAAARVTPARDALGHDRGATFDGPATLREGQAWVQQRLAILGATITGLPVAQRMARWETIQDFPTTAGTMRFKAGPGQTPRGALLGMELRMLFPDHVPALVATDPDRQWWLLADVQTRDAATDARAEFGTEEAWLRTVATLAAMQRRVLQSADALDLVRTRPFGQVQLDRVIARLRDLLEASPFQVLWTPTLLTTMVSVLRAAVYRLMSHDLPWTWTPATCRLRHLCLAAGVVRFEDPEDSYYAPPTLALTGFLDDLRTRAAVPEPVLLRLRERYVEGWDGVLAPDLLRRAIADTAIPGWLFDFWTQLERLFRGDRVATSEGIADAAHPQIVEQAHHLAVRVPARLPPAVPADALEGPARGWRQPDWGRSSS